MKIERLEAARGFAATYVLLHHAIPRNLIWSYPFRFGQEAVILFFLLSGFVIYYACRDEESYFLKRAVRIYTPFIPALIMAYCVECWLQGGFVSPFPDFLGNLVMLQDSGPGSFVAPYMANNPLWSLSYEWWFYMAFPLLMRIKAPTVWVVSLGVICAVAYRFEPVWPLRWGLYLSIWWTGAMVARDYIAGRMRLASLAPLAAVTLALGLTILPGFRFEGFGATPFLEFRHLAAALAIAVFAFVWRRLGWIGFDWTLRPFLLIAPVSYGLYIVHRPLLRLSEGLPGRLALIVVAFAFAWLLERQLYPRVRRLFFGRSGAPRSERSPGEARS